VTADSGTLPRVSEPTDEEIAAEIARERAELAARRLDMVATVLIVLATLGMAILVGLGADMVSKANVTDSDRNTGIGLIAGGIAGWLQALLVCFAAQALARYIQMRAAE
jgi:hypothetical protein